MEAACLSPVMSDAPYNAYSEVKTGTTIMAIKCRGGVVLAADTRTSAGGYIVNRASRKITPVTDKIYCCRSGSAADTQFLAQLVKRYMSEHAMELQSAEVPVAVTSAANLFRLVAYENKNHVSAALIIAGVDDLKGPQILSIPLGGTLTDDAPYAFSGSGSAFVSAMLQAEWRDDMEPAEAVAFARRIVSHAMFNDASSGGMIRTVLITKDKTEEEVVCFGEGRLGH